MALKAVICLPLAALLLIACRGDGREDVPSPVPTSADDAPGQTSLTEELIYWDALDFYGEEVPPESMAAFQALTATKDEQVIPYLMDMLAVPTPFRGHALEVLTAWLGAPGGFGPFEWWEQRGYREADEDTPEYLAFKQRLFWTIQPEMGDFLDPDAAKTISAQEVMWGGVTVDGIPPLNDTRFVTPEQAESWISPTDEVIGVEVEGDVRAYPRRIIDWHEMVNDVVGGRPVSLAYCTLCGSAILYDGTFGGTVYRFGTSGLLYRSNKLMYDHATRTLWEQYTGEPVWGELVGKGIRLETLPVVHTTYGEWLSAHPDTKVLDIETGYRRDYGSGVAYADYWADPQLMFPAPNRSGPLGVKDEVYAVRVDGQLTAYPIDVVAERAFIEDSIAGRGVVVVATADGSGARAYERGDLTFVAFDVQAGTLRSSDGRRWRLTEPALVAEDGSELPRLAGHNSFWFSVTNHTPNGRLYGQ